MPTIRFLDVKNVSIDIYNISYYGYFFKCNKVECKNNNCLLNELKERLYYHTLCLGQKEFEVQFIKSRYEEISNALIEAKKLTSKILDTLGEKKDNKVMKNESKVMNDLFKDIEKICFEIINLD